MIIILCWLKNTGKTDRYVEWPVVTAAERPLDLLVIDVSPILKVSSWCM